MSDGKITKFFKPVKKTRDAPPAAGTAAASPPPGEASGSQLPPDVDAHRVLETLLSGGAIAPEAFQSALEACEAEAEAGSAKRRRVGPAGADAVDASDAPPSDAPPPDVRLPVPVGTRLKAWRADVKAWRFATVTGGRRLSSIFYGLGNDFYGEEYLYDVRFEKADIVLHNVPLPMLRHHAYNIWSPPYTQDGTFHPVYISEWTGSRRFRDPFQWRGLDALVIGVYIPGAGMTATASMDSGISKWWNGMSGDALKRFLGRHLQLLCNWHQHISPQKFRTSEKTTGYVIEGVSAPSTFSNVAEDVPYDVEHLWMLRRKYVEVHYIGHCEHSMNEYMRAIAVYQRLGYHITLESGPALR